MATRKKKDGTPMMRVELHERDRRKKAEMTKNDLKELMRLKKWNQKQLADALGLTEASISLWLSGDRSISNPTRILLQGWLTAARDEDKQPEPARASA